MGGTQGFAPERIDALWQRLQTETLQGPFPEVEAVVEALDAGRVRVAEAGPDGAWRVNRWVKQALDVYFRTRQVTARDGALPLRDRFDLKGDPTAWDFRVGPPGAVRRPAFVGEGSTVLAGYVNLGAHIGRGTLIDTWASVGTCAQVGDRVTVMPGAVIVGSLHPLDAVPAVVEDDCYIGANAVVEAGVVVRRRSVLGHGTILSASLPLADATVDGRWVRATELAEGAVILSNLPVGATAWPPPGQAATIIGYRQDGESRSDAMRRCLAPVLDRLTARG